MKSYVKKILAAIALLIFGATVSGIFIYLAQQQEDGSVVGYFLGFFMGFLVFKVAPWIDKKI